MDYDVVEKSLQALIDATIPLVQRKKYQSGTCAKGAVGRE
jgi:hypothetical protein